MYVDNWVSQVSRMLHEGVIYRHIVLTMPQMLRQTFYQQANKVLSPLMQCGVRCLDDVFSRLSGQPLKGGYIVVVQTHGRNGQYNPHLHIIATSGGWNAKARQWVHLDFFPYPLMRKKWQWHLLKMLRQTIPSREVNRLIDTCYRKYQKGFVTDIQKGDVPSRYESLARYLAKYVVSPPISLRRIDRYDGQRVTYHYRSHRSERVERETVEVYTFIGRMVQHVFPKGFQRVRYYGVQATKTFEKIKGLIQEALSKVKGVVKGAIRIIAPMTYRQRYEQSRGLDPLICPHCQHEMGVWRIWHPTYGLIHDEFKAIERGKYASKAKRVDPSGGAGCSLRPPAGGVSLPLPGVR